MPGLTPEDCTQGNAALKYRLWIRSGAATLLLAGVPRLGRIPAGMPSADRAPARWQPDTALQRNASAREWSPSSFRPVRTRHLPMLARWTGRRFKAEFRV